MATVLFTSALKRFFPNLNETRVIGSDVKNILVEIEKTYPGLNSYIVDENGMLRKHVNIFVRGELIKDRESLSDPVNDQDEVLIFQALSGG